MRVNFRDDHYKFAVYLPKTRYNRYILIKSPFFPVFTREFDFRGVAGIMLHFRYKPATSDQKPATNCPVHQEKMNFASNAKQSVAHLPLPLESKS
jgi:hypothetical protein